MQCNQTGTEKISFLLGKLSRELQKCRYLYFWRVYKTLWDCILLTGYKTVVNGIVEEKLSRSTVENITRWKMWFLSPGYDFKQTLFSWCLNANFTKYHVVCAQVSGQDINLSKGKDKRDTLLLVIGHGCLLCSFPWKIALGKAGYFQHCISDLDKHLRIRIRVLVSLCMNRKYKMFTSETRFWNNHMAVYSSSETLTL